MNNQLALIEAVSSQRSGEIEPKAGNAIPKMQRQFASKKIINRRLGNND